MIRLCPAKYFAEDHFCEFLDVILVAQKRLSLLSDCSKRKGSVSGNQHFEMNHCGPSHFISNRKFQLTAYSLIPF